MFTVSVSEFDETGKGTTRCWFLSEETISGLEAELAERFGPPMAEALSPAGDERSVVLLADGVS